MYKKALKGFAVSNLNDKAVEALRNDPQVAYVEPDGIVTIDGTQLTPPSWGLDRIDAAAGYDNSYTYPITASNVTAYIIDTGILASHNDFGGRVGPGRDFIDGDSNPVDCNGHGTHVAGTVGGNSYGVAKGVTIVSVRVLDCSGSGTTSGVIAGVDWVASNAHFPAVANMSLGGGASLSLDNAVANAIAKGVVFAVAAGNSNANACNYSPARASAAITVGATTSADGRASYSNYGTCVDINAPGSGITSAWIGSNSATNTISGTSMASPHVAGGAALVLGSNPTWTPQQVRDDLVARATSNAITGLPSGTPNKLLFVGAASGGGGGGGPTLSAKISKSCSGFKCTFTSTSTGNVTSTSWHFSDSVGDASGVSQVSRTVSGRANYSVTLTVGDGSTTSSATSTVTCNPKKCQ
jgi:subtilisin family serine protease